MSVEYQDVIEGLLSPEMRSFIEKSPAGNHIWIWAASDRDGEILGVPLRGSPDVPRGKIYSMDPRNDPSRLRGVAVT